MAKGIEVDPVNPTEELSTTQKTMVDALMDYIATTPQNINYNIVREILKAVILNEAHPYFDYYKEKINSEETSDAGKEGPGSHHDPFDGKRT